MQSAAAVALRPSQKSVKRVFSYRGDVESFNTLVHREARVKNLWQFTTNDMTRTNKNILVVNRNL